MRAQALSLEAVLALFIAVLFVFLLLGTPTGMTWDMQLERAGYDVVNAVYADDELYGVLVAGAERNEFYASEQTLISSRLSRYVHILGIAKIELEVEGVDAFVGRNEELPEPMNKETFYALIPVRGGEDYVSVLVKVWI